MIPHENIKDLKEIPANVKEGLDIIPVQWITEVLEVALQKMPAGDDSKQVISQDKSNYHELGTQNHH